MYLLFYSLDNGIPFELYNQLNHPEIWMSSTSVVLASIIFCQIGMGLNCRSKDQSIFKLGIFSNKELIVGIIFEVALLMVVIFVPFLNTDVFETNVITDYKIWLIILTFPFIIILVEELRKYIINKKKEKNKKIKEIDLTTSKKGDK